MSNPLRKKPISVTQLIASSRFAMHTDYFDVKIVRHGLVRDSQDPQAESSLIQENRPPRGRLVIAVPRRVGTAPVRNRCRRRIRELMRTMELSSLPCDFIFFVRKSFADIPVGGLREMLEKLRKRVQK